MMMTEEPNNRAHVDKSSMDNSLNILEDIPPETWKERLLRFVRKNCLTACTILAVILGIVVGFILRASKSEWTSREVMYVGFCGELFLRILKCLILPLMMSSLVSSICGLDLSLSTRIAIKTISLFIGTTFLAVIIGIGLVVALNPGSSHSGETTSTGPVLTRTVTTSDTILDLIRNMFPPNIVQASMQTAQTTLVVDVNETDVYRWKIGEEAFVAGANNIGVVVFSVVFGVATAVLRDEARPAADFFRALLRITMRLTHWCIMLSPGGVFFLVTSRVLSMEDMADVMAKLGYYFMTVLLGLAVHGLLVMPTIFFLFTRKSPLRYLLNLKPAIFMAFGTASSAATLPLTMECLEEYNDVDPRITGFALPISITINLNGTALYEAVAAIFIAQVHNVPLGVGKLLAVSIAATAASMGGAGIPQAGLVTMVLVLDTIGLPAGEVTMIYAIDWLLDRFRTTINVMSGGFSTGIVHHSSVKDLPML